ncbi:MAG: excinuclease ABC subunit UvrC [Lachnospiraceae bacterium]|nr:excinuclease ABC subunit UvrC [Lachnospiraceae bacterium]MDE6252114.1 excinuclease ABC subunit UvrC [Lachnospiraceae bacterium]
MYFNIEEELKKLPGQPGVYLMHDDKDEIIYVGKAISLKNRVRQYFQTSRNRSSKIEQMVSRIKRFEYIVTDSEMEALILECNLIKEHQPRYNTMLKDDKAYPFIRLTVKEEYPRVMIARDMKKDGSKYYGPFTNAGAVKDTIELLTKIYKLRTCRKSLPKDMGKGRPCLNYHMHQCDAPCMGYISKEEYHEKFKKAQEFLNGNYKEVMEMLQNKMYSASENMEYEEAAQYRDLLNSVKSISQRQKITGSEFVDRDIMAYSVDGYDAVVQVFFIRQGKMLGREHFHLTTALQNGGGELLSSFIKQYYAGTPYIPQELLVPQEIEDAEVIEQWLTMKRGQKVSIKTPKKGEKEKLVELAKKNATMVLVQDREKIKREELRTTGAMKEISELMGLGYIKRVEAFDISNTNGFESVGSMIVYEDGRPRRNCYRKFKIKWVKGADDYSSMEEVLTRRFEHGLNEIKELKEKNLDENIGKFTEFPDLIMMDGGKGQVNVALRVLEKYNLDIPVCGMVKDDHHRTRGLYYKNEEIPISTNSEGFRLITRIQDEAHRFAIEFHRSLRSKAQVHSILDDIEGIGKARRKSLMKEFKSLENIKNASVDELKKIPTMNETVAQKVYDFFH